jgi:hypothetical protein
MPNNIVNADLQPSVKCNTFAEQYARMRVAHGLTHLSFIINSFIGQIGVKMIDN